MRPQVGATEEATHDEFLFGGPDVPLCGGYTIGYRIVQAYLRRHPEMEVATWTGLRARELLEQSGYEAGR